MEAPESVVRDLKSIRPGLHLRWNPQAVRVRPGFIDGSGLVTPAAFDGRWELWDVDPYGNEYQVMRLETADGGFHPPGQWLVETCRMLNPEHYGGDLDRLTAMEVDAPNDLREELSEKEFNDLIDTAARWYRYAHTAKERVLDDRAKGGSCLISL